MFILVAVQHNTPRFAYRLADGLIDETSKLRDEIMPNGLQPRHSLFFQIPTKEAVYCLFIVDM